MATKTQKNPDGTYTTYDDASYTPSTLSSTSLTPSASLNFQTPQSSDPYNIAGLGDYGQVFSPSPEENKATDLMTRLQELNNQNIGKSAAQGQAETAQGLPDLLKTNTDLQSNLKALQNESLAIPMQLQQNATGKGITEGGLAPIQTAALRNNAIKALSISSLLAANQGQISTAQSLADKAVAQRFDPIQEEIAAKTANLDLILKSPGYTLAEKKRAQAQQDIQTAKAQQVKNQREDMQTMIGWGAVASQNGASSYQAQQIANAPDLQTALGLYAPFSKDPNEVALQVGQLQAQRDAHNKSVADTQKLNAEISGMGVPTITNPNAGKYAGALSVVLGSGKFTKDQKVAVINGVNNGEDPIAVIRNQAKAIMTGANQTKVESYETAQDSLKSVASNLQAYYDAGGSTNLFSGNYEKVINKLGQVNNPKLVELATQIQQSLQIYRNAVSGTAYSVQEGADIASIFPGIQKSQLLNNSIIAGRLRAFSDGIDGAYRGVLGTTYDSLKESTGKGSQTDSQFVEKALNSKGLKYADAIKGGNPGEIAVVDNATGEIGYIPVGEFNIANYTRL